MHEATHLQRLLPVGHLQWVRKKLDNLLAGVLTHGAKKCLVFNSIYLLLAFLLPFLRPNFMTVNAFPWKIFLFVTAPHAPGSGEFLQARGLQ